MGRPRSRSTAGMPANLYLRGSYYSWRDPRTGKEYGLGRDRVEAFSQAIEANHLLDAAPEHRLVDRVTGKAEQTFKAWCERYTRIAEDRGLRKTSLAAVRTCLVEPLRLWGDRLLTEISIQDIADLLKTYTDADKKRMASLVRSRLVDVFREAMVAGWIMSNPAEVTKVYGVKVKRQRLSLEQFEAIYAWSATPDCQYPWLGDLLALALLTGQRREDLASLALQDVREGYLWVRQTKTGSPVALSLELSLDALPGLTIGSVIERCRQRPYSIAALLHHRRTSGKYHAGGKLAPKMLSEAFAAAREAVGIDGDNPPTLHETRSLSGRLYEQKYGKDFAQALWGHRNANTSATYLDTRGSEWKKVDPVSNEFRTVSRIKEESADKSAG